MVFMAWAIIADDPLGGEPMAMVPANARPEAGAGAAINPTRPAGTPTVADQTRPNRYDGPSVGDPPREPEPPAGSKTVNIIDGSSGKRQQVVIPSTPEDKPSD